MWGRPDAIDRIAQALVGFAALASIANGLFMVADPFGWYEWVGTVKASGPPNRHFIADVGLAYLLSGWLLAHAAINLPMRWGAALAGTVWLLAHGLLHIWEVGTGLCSSTIFWREAPGVLGPPLIALAGIGLQVARQRISPAPLPTGYFMKMANRLTGGLSPQLADIAAAPGFMAEKYRHFMPLALHRHAASVEMLNMARLGAVLAEDCGPCATITARGALANGLPRELVNAALSRCLPEGEASQAFAFGEAIALNQPEVADLGDGIEAAHGRHVRTELALAAAMVRTYPAIKRGLGYAQSCSAAPPQV